MSLYKRNKYWFYDFIRNGKRFQGSTRQTNVNEARKVEDKLKTDCTLEGFGIGPQKASPLFKDFMEGQFLDYCGRHAKAKNTLEFYKKRTAQLLKFPGFKDRRLSEIDGELIEKYSGFREDAVSINTLNGELKALSRALHLAAKWNLLGGKNIKAPTITRVPGAKGRDFVVSPALERVYLEKATYPLKQIATLILDLGLRPEECVSLDKRHISEDAVTVRAGKTANADRTLPMTQRAKQVIELCSALFPDSLWLFPGKRAGTHLTRGAVDDLHAKLRTENDWPREFVLHGFRHTRATRLAESGASPFDIMKILGHATIQQAMHYVHTGEDSVRLAMRRSELYDRILRGEDVQDLASDVVRKN